MATIAAVSCSVPFLFDDSILETDFAASGIAINEVVDVVNNASTQLDHEKRTFILLISLAAAKFMLHFGINLASAYGYFRDEFYYIACSDHLAFGYVDQPPLSILLLKISRVFFGDSLAAIRLFPALAGALTVFLTGKIVKELGGGRFAQLFAALCVLLAPLPLALGSYYSMNAWDLLVWTLAVWILVKWINRSDPKLWLWLGVVLGLGLQNKISVLWLGAGLTLGLLVTPLRASLRTRGPWLAAGIASLLFLPHIIWQVLNGWPTLEFMSGAAGKMAEVTFLRYLGSQILEMNPLLFPVWFTGLVWYLFAPKGKQYRMLGIIYVVVFALLVISGNVRTYYLAPAYPMLFASGALLLEEVSGTGLLRWARWAFVVLVLQVGIIAAPMAVPVLPVEKFIQYSEALGMKPKTEEKHRTGSLPQFFADMHGWEEIVNSVAKVYENVREDVRSDGSGRWAVFTGNYGVAGAVNFLGKKYDLPPAISGHNNYWLWGPGDPPPENLIMVDVSFKNEGLCGQAWQAGTTDCTYCMPYEDNNPIFVCMGFQGDPDTIWSEVKHFE